MATSTATTSPMPLLFLYSSLVLLLVSQPCFCADPDPTQDLCVANLSATVVGGHFPCKPASAVTADDFFFAGLSNEANISNFAGFGLTSGSVQAFPGLNTLGISMNRVDIAPGGVVPPHTHPRATELTFVVRGRMLIGFITTGGVLFSKTVKAGETFVVPRGLMHFQYNMGKEKAMGIVAFNSQLPGGVLASTTLFGSRPSIPNVVIAKSFQIDDELVDAIRAKFGGPRLQQDAATAAMMADDMI